MTRDEALAHMQHSPVYSLPLNIRPGTPRSRRVRTFVDGVPTKFQYWGNELKCAAEAEEYRVVSELPDGMYEAYDK